MNALGFSCFYILQSQLSSVYLPCHRGLPLVVLDQRISFSCRDSGNEDLSQTKDFTALLGFKNFILKKYEDGPEFECHERARENSSWISIDGYRFWLFQKTARGQFGHSNINTEKRFLVPLFNDAVLHATTKPENIQRHSIAKYCTEVFKEELRYFLNFLICFACFTKSRAAASFSF